MYIGRLSLLAAICCAFAPAQTISSLQSSTQANFPNAANVTTIDGGIASLPNGFLLYINGAFNTGLNPTVTWTNQNPSSGNQSGTLGFFTSATATQLVVVVPPSFFSAQVATPETVLVTVTQGANTSPPATFTIVPLPTAFQLLPTAAVGVPYSGLLVQDGSPPFDTSMLSGFPPNLAMNPAGNTVIGTPTSSGQFQIFGFVTDFWGFAPDVGSTIQVIGPPVFGVFISSAGFNYSYGTLTNLTMPLGPVPPVPPFSPNIVQFFDNNTLLGTVSVAPSGLAQLNGVFLAAGTHNNIKVAFLGDANWAPANAGPFTINVAPASPVASFTGTPITASYGGTLSTSTLTIGGVGQGVAPTGTVTVSAGGSILATFNNLNPGGVVTPLILTGLQLPAGAFAGNPVLSFNYSGDTNYLISGGATNLVVNRAQPTATLGVAANPIAVGQTETFTATLRAPGRGTPSGTVSFTDGATPLGAASLNGAGIATFSTSTLTLGQHSIGYFYNGDNNFLGAQPSTTTVNVNSLALSIPTAFLPGGVEFQPYGGATIVVTGGSSPYTIIASGLPSGMSINAQTGAITGTPSAAGTFSPTFTATDSLNNKVSTTLSLTIAVPPVRISTPSTLPDGTVGVGYSATIGTLGGTSPITFTFTGSPPPGLSFIANSGLVTGTPTTVGTFGFTVKASDAANTSDARDFTITIKPPPLSIPGGPTNPTGTSGTPFKVDFGCTGGVPPYRVTTTGTLPPGTTLTNCTLSGTPTTPGTYPIHIVVTDSTGATATRDAIITIAAPTLALAGGSLGDGQVGVAYTGKIGATGGLQPYSYSGSGLPDGLSLSSAGDITGTPTTAGQFSFRVTVKDSSVATAPATASATYSINILPPTLAFGQATLPDGVVGVAYSGSLTATGGVKPYRFSGSGLPDGLTLNSDGTVTGTPTTAGTFTANANVSDAGNGAARQTFSVKIAPPPLTIPTTSAVNGTVGAAYSMTFSAAGGTQPYSFSASGQPGTLTMSASGTLSGTPTAPGSFTVAVTVKDGSGTTATKSFPITIVLPASPPLNFGGISTTVGSAQQPRVSVSLGSVYPVDVLVTLTLVLTPDSGPVDPNVVFSTGGTTTTITIPAGSLNGATDVGFQTGTVAGTIAITAKLAASGVDVTPSPAPRSTTRVVAGAPVIVSATGTRTSSGFTITAIGYVTDREMTTGIFGFSGSNLGTTTLTVTVDTLFAGWLGGNAPPSAAFGSQFTYTQPFAVNGTNTAITTVTLTLNNKVGASNTVTVTLQ